MWLPQISPRSTNTHPIVELPSSSHKSKFILYQLNPIMKPPKGKQKCELPCLSHGSFMSVSSLGTTYRMDNNRLSSWQQRGLALLPRNIHVHCKFFPCKVGPSHVYCSILFTPLVFWSVGTGNDWANNNLQSNNTHNPPTLHDFVPWEHFPKRDLSSMLGKSFAVASWKSVPYDIVVAKDSV